MKKTILLFILVAFASVSFAKKDGGLELYHKANIAYQKMDYATAISTYEQMVKFGYVSADVYYNLGNAYFKNGNVPKAILNFERAKKLNPEDEDVDFNLKIASLKVVDKMSVVPEVFYKRWIKSASSMMSSSAWTTILIVFVWLLFASASLYVFSHVSSRKKAGFLLVLVFGALSICTYVFASRSHSLTWKEKEGIIMEPSIYVKSSPDIKGTDVFMLHEGTKVSLLDELNGWMKIRIASGNIGWVRKTDLETI